MKEKLLEKLIEALMSMPESADAMPEGDGLAVKETEVKALTDGEEMPLDLGAETEEDELKKKLPLELE